MHSHRYPWDKKVLRSERTICYLLTLLPLSLLQILGTKCSTLGIASFSRLFRVSRKAIVKNVDTPATLVQRQTVSWTKIAYRISVFLRCREDWSSHTCGYLLWLSLVINRITSHNRDYTSKRDLLPKELCCSLWFSPRGSSDHDVLLHAGCSNSV
jgi:hypothetical protein